MKQKDEFKQNSRQKSILIEGRGVDFGMKLFRFIIPKYPYFNVYTRVKMPPRGAVSVATAVAQTGRYRVEIIDENNFTGGTDHGVIQRESPADFVGLYVKDADKKSFLIWGIPCFAAYANSSSLPIAHSRTGAIILSWGARVIIAPSSRT